MNCRRWKPTNHPSSRTPTKPTHPSVRA